MAESYSVKAILSAVDSGFSSTLKRCSSALDSIDSKISGFSFGILAGAGQAAFNAVTGSVSELISEMNNSNAAWKTFEGNMKILNGENKETENQIKSVRKELQKYAQETIYSSSDMASTYAQLAAVGTENTDKLVMGFGGLAGAAENPKQAMKTLSQQATQMAGRPTVAWQDFKLMLEQTPAGMAAVAKHMGMTTQEMVGKIQKGEIATKDFFKAVEEVGNSKGFYDLATQYKTAGQAMDGLTETLGNKLMPAFDVLSKTAIGAIEGIISKMDEFDAEGIASKVSSGLKKAEKYWVAFKEAFSGVGTELGEAFTAIKTSLTEISGAFGSAENVSGFKSAMQSVADVIKGVANFATEHADAIAKLISWLPKIVIGIKGFQIAKTVAPFVGMFASGIAALGGKTISGIAAKLLGISMSQDKVGKSSSVSGKKLLASAKSYALMGVAVLMIAAGFGILAYSAIQLANAGGLAIGVMAGLVVGVAAIGLGMAFLLKSLAPISKKLMPVATAMLALGAAVLLVSAGFAILTYSAIQIANAGWLAIGVMVGMVATIALLAVGAAALGTALTAGAVGFIAFGAAIALVGLGALLAASALAIVASVLPVVSAYGTQSATAIAALGVAMIAFAAGASLAGTASMVLGAGLLVASVGIAAVGVSALVAAVGILALSAGFILLAGSLALTGAAIALVAGMLPLAASGAMASSAAFAALMATTLILTASLIALNVPLVLVGASALVAGAGMLVFGAGMITGAAGTLAMAAALKSVSKQMKTIAQNAKTAQSSLTSMRNSISIVEAGLSTLGTMAQTALNQLKTAFSTAATDAMVSGTNVGLWFAQGMMPGLLLSVNKAKTTKTQIHSVFVMCASATLVDAQIVGENFVSGLQSGIALAPDVAQTAVNNVIKTFRSGRPAAYAAGAYISEGFAEGMESCLGRIQAAAAAMVAAAEEAIRAKAMIASPSKLTDKLGQYFGEGFVNGVTDKVKDAKEAARELISIPTVATPRLATAYGYELSGDYTYTRNNEYVIEVPLSVDGREFAKATASYTEEELNRKQARDYRKRGRV